MPRLALALVFHNHQPVGNFGWVMEDVYRTAYEPMLAALERHPGVQVGLHYTGPLLEWLLAQHPEAITRLRELVDRGQVEMLGGALYEPILVALPERDRQAQLRRMADEVERHFGRRPGGAWLAERVWEPAVAADLARAGYRYTILDDNHLRGASVPEDGMWTAFTTDDRGERLTIFGTEQGLRYRIPFGQVRDLIDYLRAHASDEPRIGVMGDDGEKLGAWPSTHEHCWGSGRWVDDCFAAFEANQDWLTTTTPGSWLEQQRPTARVYPPTSSYVEMTEWALPPDEASVFHRLLTEARAEGRAEARFLRGGTWRAFQARYREINDLHKRMLRVSAAVAAMPPGPDREAATDHLHRGQSNDTYWHGLFGGIYLVHLRMATLAHLIAAEDLADTAAGQQTRALEADLDLDGHAEVLLGSPGQVITVKLSEGAGIGDWDLRASRVALASVMRRRPEAYHALLRAPAPEVGAAGGSVSPHEVTRVKEAGLAEALVYDDHERRGGLVRLVGQGTTPEALRRVEALELGDFVAEPWELVDLAEGALTARRTGTVSGAAVPAPLTVTKQLRLGGSRLRPTLELTVRACAGEVPVSADLVVEWGFDLSGGGHNPAAWYEYPAGETPVRAPHDGSGELPAAERVAFGNDQDGVRVDLELHPAGSMAWYPIETISNSESGVERIYQGSCLMPRWPLRLAPHAEAAFSMRFAISQRVDGAQQEPRPEVAPGLPGVVGMALGEGASAA